MPGTPSVALAAAPAAAAPPGAVVARVNHSGGALALVAPCVAPEPPAVDPAELASRHPLRRPSVSRAPRPPCDVPPPPSTPRDGRLCAVSAGGEAVELRGKGTKHAKACAGPFVSALLSMPPLPLEGARRHEAGLADVVLTHGEKKRIKVERSARSLVALLPRSSAKFVLEDSDELMASRSDAETAELLVAKVAAASQSPSGIDGAASLLGRLLSFVSSTYLGATIVEGSYMDAFFKAYPPSVGVSGRAWWLRDHCGVGIPVRGPTDPSGASRRGS